MKLEDIRFPLYVVHSDEVIRRDGVLWIEGAVLDDSNVEGNSIGERRLRTPLKNMYDLISPYKTSFEVSWKHQNKILNYLELFQKFYNFGIKGSLIWEL